MALHGYTLAALAHDRHTADRRTAQQQRNVRQARHLRAGAPHDPGAAPRLGG
jgi:hypothetical protein